MQRSNNTYIILYIWSVFTICPYYTCSCIGGIYHREEFSITRNGNIAPLRKFLKKHKPHQHITTKKHSVNTDIQTQLCFYWNKFKWLILKEILREWLILTREKSTITRWFWTKSKSKSVFYKKVVSKKVNFCHFWWSSFAWCWYKALTRYSCCVDTRSWSYKTQIDARSRSYTSTGKKSIVICFVTLALVTSFFVMPNFFFRKCQSV